MNSVIALRADVSNDFDLVELIVAGAVGNSVNAGRHLLFVVIDSDVKSTEGPDHSVDATNVRRDFLNGCRLNGFAGRRRSDPIKPAELVTDKQSSFVVGA